MYIKTKDFPKKTIQVGEYVIHFNKTKSQLPKQTFPFSERKVTFDCQKPMSIEPRYNKLEYFIYGFIEAPTKLKQIQQTEWFYYPEYWLKNYIDANDLQNYACGKFLPLEEARKDFLNNSDININIDITKVDYIKFLDKHFGVGEKKYLCDQLADSVQIECIKQSSH